MAAERLSACSALRIILALGGILLSQAVSLGATPRRYTEYFPPGLLPDELQRLYGEPLIALGEPPLAALPDEESYRFLYAPRGGGPRMIRVTRMGDTVRYRTAFFLPGDWRLYETEPDLNRWAIFHRGRVIEDRSGSVCDDDWRLLRRLLAATSF